MRICKIFSFLKTDFHVSLLEKLDERLINVFLRHVASPLGKCWKTAWFSLRCGPQGLLLFISLSRELLTDFDERHRIRPTRVDLKTGTLARNLVHNKIAQHTGSLEGSWQTASASTHNVSACGGSWGSPIGYTFMFHLWKCACGLTVTPSRSYSQPAFWCSCWLFNHCIVLWNATLLFIQGMLDISRNGEEFWIESGSSRSTITHLHRKLVLQKNKIKGGNAVGSKEELKVLPDLKLCVL